jgi:hypothetical protein
MIELRVTSVACCGCKQHHWVYLADANGEWQTEFTLDPLLGDAILAELTGRKPPSPPLDCGHGPAPAGIRPSAIELRWQADDLTATLHPTGTAGPTSEAVCPCHALLLACRLRLPILADQRDASFFRRAPVPPAFDAVPGVLDPDDPDGRPRRGSRRFT